MSAEKIAELRLECLRIALAMNVKDVKKKAAELFDWITAGY